MWRWRHAALGMMAAVLGSTDVLSHDQDWRGGYGRSAAGGPADFGDARAHDDVRQGGGSFWGSRRDYRPYGRGSGGRDWPLDQSTSFRGPRDAYGGRWIYVRPSPRYGYRSERFAGASRHGGYDRYRPRWHDRVRNYEGAPPPGPAEPPAQWGTPRGYAADTFDRYPYIIGRRREF